MLTPLILRSSYSMLRGVPTPEALVGAASAAGLERLALTDRNGVYGVPTFVEACRKVGIAPMAGVELAYEGGRAILLPRTRAGFSAICRLLTLRAAAPAAFDVRAAIAGLLGRAAVPTVLAPFASAPAGSAQRAAVPPAPASLAPLDSASADDALFVLTDDLDLLGRLSPSETLYALATPCNRSAWRRLASSRHRPAASPEISFLEPGQHETQRLLLAIGAKKTVHDIEDRLLDPPEALWSPGQLGEGGPAGELWHEAGDVGLPAGASRLAPNLWACRSDLLPWLEEAFAANGFIARGALAEPFSGFVFPRFDQAGGKGAGRASEPSRPASGSSIASECLRDLVLKGAARRYGVASPAVTERIEYELGLIERKGFCDYFLVVKEIASWASRTCGRGSAAASIVSYCLGITEVDPLRHGLYFERFLNPDRKDPPDIDVDFAWDERDALLEKVTLVYGPGRTARVANHNCFRRRSALRETAHAYGMPDAEIAEFERSLDLDPEGNLAAADPEWKAVAEASAKIVGLPRHLGTHSGGVVIVPGNLADHAPVETTGTGIRVIAWDKEGAEEAGLVKIDLLGNRSLAVVRDALANLEANGEPIDRTSWRPLDDPATVALLARGDTMGVFYVESPAMRILQAKTKRGDFEHLVIHSSIIRPAANKYINEYVDRLEGKPWKPFHPRLAGLFNESFGILCYQEDVSKAAIALAGFSAAEADGIRKILSKKDAEVRLREYRGAFLSGAAARGVDPESAEAVWAMICSFSGYSFVKAHSASYAMLSFQSAYLRAHHPAEFMAAVLSNHGGFYSTLAYASEARRMGLILLGPDVNASAFRCSGSGRRLRFGLCMIPSLGAKLAEELLAERGRHGPYRSAEDFANRLNFDRAEAEALVGSGAFDSLLGGRPRSSALMTLLSLCVAREGEASASAPSLFPEDETPAGGGSFGGAARGSAPRASSDPAAFTAALPAAAPEASPRRRRQAEFKYLGTTLDVHPLELWPRAFARPRDRARDLPRSVGRRVTVLAWPITAKPVLTAAEEQMEFVSFEDETAIFEAVLFPAAYRRFRHLLFESRPLWVCGLVERDRGAITLTVESIVPA
ncbi:DNA polymerase III subunit alpha [bacterium]|nr:DNA polymerase III subunit alpha [bacterium]